MFNESDCQNFRDSCSVSKSHVFQIVSAMSSDLGSADERPFQASKGKGQGKASKGKGQGNAFKGKASVLGIDIEAPEVDREYADWSAAEHAAKIERQQQRPQPNCASTCMIL